MTIMRCDEFQLWVYLVDEFDLQHVGFIKGFRPEMDNDFIYYYPKKDSPSISAIKKSLIGGFTVMPIQKE
ncbi:TPA: hypothetical protein ACHT5R_001688 [Citrobacter freundii]|nr:hypothetical protein [Citrobacter freundii]HBM9444198.1 hypothetical protein [Citrobacter freundii]